MDWHRQVCSEGGCRQGCSATDSSWDREEVWVGDVCTSHYCISLHQKDTFRAQSNHVDFCNREGRLFCSEHRHYTLYAHTHRYNGLIHNSLDILEEDVCSDHADISSRSLFDSISCIPPCSSPGRVLQAAGACSGPGDSPRGCIHCDSSWDMVAGGAHTPPDESC